MQLPHEVLLQVIEAVPQLVAWKDRSLRYEGCNARFAVALGLLRPNQIIGLREVDMPWGDRDGALEEADRRVIETGEPQHHRVHRERMLDGHLAWLGTNRVPLLDDDGSVRGVLILHADITERIEEQQALRRGESILSAVGFIAELLLRANSWKECIGQVLSMLGESADVGRVYSHQLITRADGVACARLVDDWYAPGVVRREVMGDIPIEAFGFLRWQQLAADRQAIVAQVSDLPESERAWFESVGVQSVAALPIFVRDKLWGILGLDNAAHRRVWTTPELDALKVISANLGAAIEREATQASLLQSQKLESIGLLAGGIAHDFNNLLLGTLGRTTLALKLMAPDHPARNHVEKAADSAERAADLTQQLLAYAGKGRIEMLPLDMNRLIRDNVALLETVLPDHVTVDLRLAPDLPAIVGDRGQLQQIIMNLVINAGEAMERQKQGSLLIETMIAEKQAGSLWDGPDELPPGRYVALYVADTGSGIEKGVVEHIFEPYFTTKMHGSGLGLAAALGIIKGHGGGIQVQSTPAEGSRFAVWLPALQGIKPVVMSAVKVVESNQLGGTILVIDDEDVVRHAVIDLLTLGGWQVLEAATGMQGIALYRQYRDIIKLVLLDMRMPGLSGVETLRQLQSFDPQVKVVLTSGYGEREALTRFGHTPHLSFLQKPYRLETLFDTINRAITQ
ncbi:MAG: response regulator [Anaerolineae bacterium]|nr:response regulator [Anaerolineae bacterium]